MTKEQEQALIPQQVHDVVFYDDEVTYAVVEGRAYVPIRPITEHLGLAWGSQRNRIRRDEALEEEARLLLMTAADGREREMLALPLDLMAGWLFGLQPSRVAEPLREKLTKYRKECFRVLNEAFYEGRLSAETSLETLANSGSDAAIAYQMAQAVAKLARNQLLLESRLTEHETELQVQERRLEAIEATLGDKDRYISQAQASRVSQAVRAIGIILSKQSGGSAYGSVYGELYRRFEISAYRELPATRYDEAMNWLNQWRQSLEDEVDF